MVVGERVEEDEGVNDYTADALEEAITEEGLSGDVPLRPFNVVVTPLVSLVSARAISSPAPTFVSYSSAALPSNIRVASSHFTFPTYVEGEDQMRDSLIAALRLSTLGTYMQPPCWRPSRHIYDLLRSGGARRQQTLRVPTSHDAAV